MNSVFAVPFTLRLSFLAVALGIVLLLSLESNASDSSLTFVAWGPSNSGSAHSEYYTVQMFTIDSSDSLDCIGNSQSGEIVSVRVYPEVNSLIIELYNGGSRSLRVISLSGLNEVAQIDPAEKVLVTSFHQCATGEPFGQLCLQTMSLDGRDARSLFCVSPSLVTTTTQVESELASGELRLAGYRPHEVGGDYIRFDSVTALPARPHDSVTGLLMEAFPVPESVMVFRGSRFWIMFAHEPSFLALRSVPDLKLEESEILVYTRSERVWRSIMVLGDASNVWPVNGWIAGQVRYANPNNSYTTQPDYPPEKGASDFLLNPLTLKLVSFKMTSRGEILWVDSDTVYYRSGTSLFKARIGEKDLVDQELILTDPRVEEIHWAFRKKSVVE